MGLYKNDSLEDSGRLPHIISADDAAQEFVRRLLTLQKPSLIVFVYILTNRNKSLTARIFKCSRKKVQRIIDSLAKKTPQDLLPLSESSSDIHPSLPSDLQSIRNVYNLLQGFRPSRGGNPKDITSNVEELDTTLKVLQQLGHLYIQRKQIKPR
ncbi:MAG: hypothetical protein AB1599_05850 [Planctomycetota bacterium]